MSHDSATVAVIDGLKKYHQFSLREAAAFDQPKSYRENIPVTGWGRVCAALTGPDSRSQRRHRNRKGARS